MPFIRSQNILSGSHDFSDAAFISEETHVEMSRSQVKYGDVFLNITGASIGRSAWMDLDIPANVNQHVAILRVGPELNHVFLMLFLNSETGQRQILSFQAGASREALNYAQIRQLKIPLPPLDVQKEIVAEIEGYQNVINGARAVLDSYRPNIPIHPDWPKRQLGSLATNLDSRRVPITQGDRKEGPFPYYGASGIVDQVADFIFDEDILLISEDGANLLARSTPIAFSVSGKCWVNNHAHVLKFEHPATQKFVEVYLNSISIEEFVTGAAQPKLNQQAMNSIPIPIPDDVATQQAIVAEIEAEQTLVAANRELIARFEKKIQATLARVWGEEPIARTSADLKTGGKHD